MKFKSDENLPGEVVGLLRAVGHDVHSVLDEGLGGAPDGTVALVCRTEERNVRHKLWIVDESKTRIFEG